MSNFYDSTDKYRQWEVIAYPENMIVNWKDVIEKVLQVPFCYIVHDKDNFKVEEDEEQRKIHVHIWLVWGNTTTYRNIIKHVNRLSKPGKKCCSTAQAVLNPTIAYQYLIHSDEKSKKKGKHLYDESERICCNNFDIGSLIDVSAEETCDKLNELSHIIVNREIEDYATLFVYVSQNLDKRYLYVIQHNCNYLDKICTGVWKKKEREYRRNEKINGKN